MTDILKELGITKSDIEKMQDEELSGEVSTSYVKKKSTGYKVL